MPRLSHRLPVAGGVRGSVDSHRLAPPAPRPAEREGDRDGASSSIVASRLLSGRRITAPNRLIRLPDLSACFTRGVTTSDTARNLSRRRTLCRGAHALGVFREPPVSYRGGFGFQPARRRSSSPSSTSRSRRRAPTSRRMRSPSATSPIGPPSAASGAMCPMHKPVVPPEKRPSVSSSTSLPRPAPLIAPVTASIRHAGPPGPRSDHHHVARRSAPDVRPPVQGPPSNSRALKEAVSKPASSDGPSLPASMQDRDAPDSCSGR